MKRTFLIIPIVILASCFFYVSNLLAWSDKVTHPAITKLATETKSTLGDYLINNLGFKKGLGEKINISSDNSSVLALLQKGSQHEDEGTRAKNHFHNPLKATSSAGLDDWTYYPIIWHYTGNSNLAWAQGDISSNEYSWKKARAAFCEALTASDSTTRNTKLEKTFRTLGQIVHLIQDMAVPAHTRNDMKGHMYFNRITGPSPIDWFGNNFEIYAEKNPGVVNQFGGSGAVPSFDQLGRQMKLSDFWDTDKYTGNIADSFNNGLTEYSSANFLSGYRMLGANGFPHPCKADTDYDTIDWGNPEIVDAEDGVTDHLIYVRKIEGQSSYRLMGVRYLTSDHIVFDPESQFFSLDDNCHKDYAQKLLPKAVGYSAGVINYFFRGKLEISLPSRFVYAIIDGSQPYKVFHYIKAKVKNASQTNGAFEEIGGGTLVAVAKYRLRTDTDPYNPDLSKDPPDAASRGDDFSYSVSAPMAINSLPSSGDGEEFEFDFSLAPIPAGITDLYLQVVFQGTLGNEEGTAVAVGMKDLTEPVHIALMNTTDRYYLNQQLKTATEMEEILDDNATLRSGLVCNKNEEDEYVCDHPIYPFDVKYKVAFYPPASAEPDLEDDTRCSIILDRLMPSTCARVIVLGDMDETIWIKYRHTPLENYMGRNAGMDEGPFYNTVKMVTYQEDDAGEFIKLPATHEDMALLRGTNQHVLSAFSIYSPIMNGIWQAPWPPLANEEPVPINTINK